MDWPRAITVHWSYSTTEKDCLSQKKGGFSSLECPQRTELELMGREFVLCSVFYCPYGERKEVESIFCH